MRKTSALRLPHEVSAIPASSAVGEVEAPVEDEDDPSCAAKGAPAGPAAADGMGAAVAGDHAGPLLMPLTHASLPLLAARLGRSPTVSAQSRGVQQNDAVAKIRVFLLDDHEVVRVGVRDLLESEGDIEVVGEASTAAEALARVPAVRPDVAVLDVRLPDGDGVSVCRELRSQLPDLKCLMLTSFADDEALLDAVLAGASGYVLKQVRGSDILGAVRTVAGGGSLLDPATAARVMQRMRDQAQQPDPLAGLSEQERKVLALIGEGLTNRQIGERMFLAEKTVKNYVSNVLAKLGMERRTQAAAFVARMDNGH